MRIHTDTNGVYVNSIHSVNDQNTEGHKYQIGHGATMTYINFQNGPVKEVGVNGVTNESLLAILINRITYLNSRFSCEENEFAMIHLKEALAHLEARTFRRIQRGVEGENKA